MSKIFSKRAAAFLTAMTLMFALFLPFSDVQANTEVWSLDSFLSGSAVGSPVQTGSELMDAGIPSGLAVHSYNNKLGIHVTGRTADWNGVDIRSGTGIQNGDTITVTGRISGSPAAGESARLVRQPGHADLEATLIGANGAFTLTHTLTDGNGLSSIRVNTTGTSSFFIDTVVITRSGAAATPSPVRDRTVSRTLTSNFIGTINGWDVELWTHNRNEGSIEMVIFNDGTFSCSYEQTFNTLFRAGKKFPRNTRVDSIANASVMYNVTEFTSTGDVSYLCLYGWTRDSLIEWYVVDNWKSYRPGGNVGSARSGSTHHGTIEIDGGTYDIYTMWRINQPSIEGTSTFLQIFSVRHNKRTSGTINIAAHFDAWKNIGEVTHTEGGTTHRSTFRTSSDLHEISFCIEGFGGQRRSSGVANVDQICISYGNNALCSTNGCINCTGVAAATPTPAPSPTPTPTASPVSSPQPSPSPAPTASPSGNSQPIMQFEINSLQYLNRGVTARLDEAPYLDNGRTMVPFRAIAEGLGAEINWNDATKTVTFILNGVTASLTIDVPLPNGMGAPVIRNGRTFVPVRYVVEALNSRIEWDEATRTVSIF